MKAIAAAILLAAICVHAHDVPGFPTLPVNPVLGVPGFPDCVRNPGAKATAEPELALSCDAQPIRADQISVACVGDSITAGVHSSAANWPVIALQSNILQ